MSQNTAGACQARYGGVIAEVECKELDQLANEDPVAYTTTGATAAARGGSRPTCPLAAPDSDAMMRTAFGGLFIPIDRPVRFLLIPSDS